MWTSTVNTGRLANWQLSDDQSEQIVHTQSPRSTLRRPIDPNEVIDADDLQESQVRRDLARQRRIEEEDRLGLFGPLFEAGEDSSSN
jgi:hypothetical protein